MIISAFFSILPSVTRQAFLTGITQTRGQSPLMPFGCHCLIVIHDHLDSSSLALTFSVVYSNPSGLRMIKWMVHF